MDSTPQIELSVVLVNKYGFDRLRRVLDCLARQSLAHRMELILVSPFDAAESLPGVPAAFARVRHLHCGPIRSLGAARAIGVEACSAPYLVFAEDHCFPRDSWAEPLLHRLREGWTGVGPVVANHNPSTWTSRIDWLLNYGCFSDPHASGPATYIPPHNSAYQTAALQSLGPALSGLLEMDPHLQAQLIARGGRLMLEPRACSEHTNLSKPSAHWSSLFQGNRIYGATRAQYAAWSAPRRLFYAAALPAIAALRFARAFGMLRTQGMLPAAPMLALGATIAAAGEAWGYATGLGASLGHRVEEELDRVSGVIEQERVLLLP